MSGSMLVLLFLTQARTALPTDVTTNRPGAANAAEPTPNSPDEPVAAKLSLERAAEFLDAVSLSWTRENECGTCHTNYPYLMARPLLRNGDPMPLLEVRRFFEKEVEEWDPTISDPKKVHTYVVSTASALAFNDALAGKGLHPLTRKALDLMEGK